jgi:hypothetical protein
VRFPTDCLLFVNCAADYLKIGDLVTFKSVEFDSYICSEGILQEDVFVSKDFSQFDNCLFAIHLQRKYSAFRELQNYIRINNVDVNNTDDQEPAAQKYLQALLRGKDNERQLNDTYMRDKTGQCSGRGSMRLSYRCVASCRQVALHDILDRGGNWGIDSNAKRYSSCNRANVWRRVKDLSSDSIFQRRILFVFRENAQHLAI